MTLQIILNYTPRSHILCGEELKEKYADFRLRVLRTVEWATWHTRMKVRGGKGWCIRKANLPDLENELRSSSIPYVISEYSPVDIDIPPADRKGDELSPAGYDLPGHFQTLQVVDGKREEYDEHRPIGGEIRPVDDPTVPVQPLAPVAPTLPSNLPIPYVAITPSYYIPLPTGSILW